MPTLWSIVIPTFHRPALLTAAVRSCMSAERPEGVEIEIVVVDNSAEGDAADTCRALGAEGLRYVHEPQSGLAFARNRGIAEARGEVLVFLDDDETAKPQWLLELHRAFAASGADVICGKVEPAFLGDAPEHLAYVTDFYTRDVGRPAHADVTDILNYIGTGNSAYRMDRCFEGGTRFDHRFNHYGGEDIQLFRELRAAGCKFAWAPDAVVEEWVSEDRASLSYLRQRRRARGEQRVDGLWRGNLTKKALVPVYMAGGAAQALMHTGLALFWLAMGQPSRAAVHRTEIEGGLGKVLWIGAARKRRYGLPPS